MKFELDENLSPSLATLFVAAGHDAHSITEQGLGGKSDGDVITVCSREARALVTVDLDFANIHAYPPAQLAGIVVLRLAADAYRGRAGDSTNVVVAPDGAAAGLSVDR